MKRLEKYHEEDILEMWEGLSEDEIMIIEFVEGMSYLIAFVSKKNTRLTFEYMSLVQPITSKVPPKEWTIAVFTNEERELRIRLPTIKKTMIKSLEELLEDTKRKYSYFPSNDYFDKLHSERLNCTDWSND